MNLNIKSIRPFLGSLDFNISRRFYSEMGFVENILSKNLSVFKKEAFAFYLQDAYVKEWVDNTMIFAEVEDLESYYNFLYQLNLASKYDGVRLLPIKTFDWGREFYLHDPSGILWHFGTFSQ